MTVSLEHTTPASRSCGWSVSYAECGECDALTGLPEEEQARFEQMAADLLWNWTNRMFGVCDAEVRPCRADGGCSGSTFWGRGPFPTLSEFSGSRLGGMWTGFYPALIGGQWFNCSCGSCAGLCQCSIEEGTKAIRLPGPVVSVEEVWVDGAPLPASAWTLSRGAYLVRTDGETWPLCQDLLAPETAPDTFLVRYSRGIAVPEGGQIAAGLLACELAKAACSDPSCGLPQRVQTVTRQGVTVAVLDTFEDVQNGRTGIWLIDAWVASVIGPRRSRPSVRSVDDGPGTRRRSPWRMG